MKRITEKKIITLNDLLKQVRDNREKAINIISELCPKSEYEECDPQLDKNKEATTCNYFPLCHIMTTYAMLNDNERKQADEFMDLFYETINAKNKRQDLMYL